MYMPQENVNTIKNIENIVNRVIDVWSADSLFTNPENDTSNRETLKTIYITHKKINS